MKSATAATAPGFAGFPREAFQFFKNLANNNNRDWFLANKSTYERSCRDPFQALTVALDPPVGATRMTRMNRDIRFSKDKSPYRTHVSTMIRDCYLMLSADGLYVGAGIYMPEPAVLNKLRAAIHEDKSGKQLAAIVASLRGKDYTVESHEIVGSVPRGYSAAHPRLDLLRMKDIHAGKTIEAAQLLSGKAVQAVEKVFAEVAPLKQWLIRHVGQVSCQ